MVLVMGLLIELSLGNAWNVLIWVEDWDGIDMRILKARMVTMLGKGFPQLGFVLIVGGKELRKEIGILLVDIRKKVLVGNRKFG